jgi:cell fate regulator YaaT (PSP1 superfamily)
MGCSSCGTNKPGGCKSNGGCSSGGCNRMNVHDWLANMPLADADSACKVVEVSFNQGSRKDFFRNNTLNNFEKGDLVTVEGVSGFDVGEISLTGEVVRLQMKKRGVDEFNPEMKKVLRVAGERDLQQREHNKSREKEALIRTRAITRQLKLDMKMSEVEIQADGRKATFFYIADDRVDFRELIKILASEFKLKVEMRQIGARQEAGKVGGIGSCGRELCCSTWLTDFKSVNTTAARYQSLSINQTKLSGQCGRLKCCLNYELDTYVDALQQFPNNADSLQVLQGTATLIKKDIFKGVMWYVLPDSSKQYPISIERARKIRSLNIQGTIPEELEVMDMTTGKTKQVEPEYVDLVGQISLKSLDKKERQKKQQQKGGRPEQPRREGGAPQAQGPQRGPQANPQARPQQGQRPEARGDNQQRPQDRNQARPQRNQQQQKSGPAQPGEQGRDAKGPRQQRPESGPRPQNGPGGGDQNQQRQQGQDKNPGRPASNQPRNNQSRQQGPRNEGGQRPQQGNSGGKSEGGEPRQPLKIERGPKDEQKTRPEGPPTPPQNPENQG